MGEMMDIPTRYWRIKNSRLVDVSVGDTPLLPLGVGLTPDVAFFILVDDWSKL